MPDIIRKEILPEIFLNCIPSDKFKTNLIGINILTELDKNTAAQYALLPSLLRRGNAEFRDMESIEAYLDSLYGARIAPCVRKKGEMLAFGFICDVIDDNLAESGDNPSEKTIKLACELITKPLVSGNAFDAEYTESEKKKLADKITAEINDKRSYALKRMLEIMCEGQPFALSELGTLETAAAINPKTLKQTFDNAVERSRIEIFVCGPLKPSKAEEIFKTCLCGLKRGKISLPPKCKFPEASEKVKEKTETLDVAQGKLCMGFRTGIDASNDLYPGLVVANTIFGAGTSSKLFLNVREKLSLCYYASSSVDKCKGIMAVSSGINVKDFERARDEILAQLDDVKKGKITDEEFKTAKATVLSAMRGAEDSPGNMEEFALSRIACGCEDTQEQLIEKIEAVDIYQVIAAANEVTLDTVYFLKGGEIDEQ